MNRATRTTPIADPECEKYGIDTDDPLVWHKLLEARAREKPCRECGKVGPRRCWSICDDCADREAAERRRQNEARLAKWRPPEPVGDYQPDGHGCVEKVHPVERAYLNGEWE